MTVPSAVYNPALLPARDASLALSLRKPIVERLLAALRRLAKGPDVQHHLVLGPPGSGKTMLLRALRIALETEPELADAWFPIAFPEIQWDLARPADVWCNALEYMVVALTRRGRPGEATDLAARLPELMKLEDEERARAALQLLTERATRMQRRLVLLIDTVDVALDRLKRDQWNMREVLAAESRLLIIGASARAVEATYRYDAAFYDFFQLHELRPLPLAHVARLLEALPPHPDRDVILALPEPTLRATLTLVGTQPRTLTLMAHALRLDGPMPAADLTTAVLDAHTPWMETRMAALAPQAQHVVHALAASWHPARPSDIAARTRLTINAVSSHLFRLANEGVVERVPLPPGQRQGFQLVDRVFQVWLLLRMGQPHRRRLLIAAELLETVMSGGDARPLRAQLDDALLERPEPDDPDVLMRIAPELRAALDRPFAT